MSQRNLRCNFCLSELFFCQSFCRTFGFNTQSLVFSFDQIRLGIFRLLDKGSTGIMFGNKLVLLSNQHIGFSFNPLFFLAGFSVNDNFLFINFRLTGSPDFNNKHFFFFGQPFLIFHFLFGFFVRNADRLFAFSPAFANLFLFLFLFQGNFLFG